MAAPSGEWQEGWIAGRAAAASAIEALVRTPPGVTPSEFTKGLMAVRDAVEKVEPDA